MPSIVRQASFLAGEVSPELYAQPTPRLSVAARLLANWLVTPRGAITRRVGSRYVGTTKYNQYARLIRFAFSDAQQLLLEIGDEYIRFWSNGVLVKNGSIPVEVETPWAWDELDRLKFAQQGDVIIFVHPNYLPQILARLNVNNLSWNFGPITFYRDAPVFSSVSFSALQVTTPANSTLQPKEWEWAITQVWAGQETTPGLIKPAGTPAVAVVDPSTRTVIHISTGRTCTHFIYRGRNGIYGLIGSTDGSADFVDDGQQPDYSIQPPKEFDPFVNMTAGQYPTEVCFHQQRLLFTAHGRVWASRVGDYYNFDPVNVYSDVASFWFDLASLRYEEIRNFVPMRTLLALTNEKDWAIGGEVFTPKALSANPHGAHGCTWLDALTVGNSALYVQAGQENVIWELRYDYYTQSFQGSDLTYAARHLFEGYSIKAWDYDDDRKIVWVVRSDGTLLGMTYDREKEVVAWHRHPTDGIVIDVCCVKESGKVGVYVIAGRVSWDENQQADAWHYYIERLPDPWLTRLADGSLNPTGFKYLDSHVLGSGAVVNGLDHLEGRTVATYFSTNDGRGWMGKTYVVTDGAIDTTAEFPADGGSVLVGLPFNSDAEMLQLILPGSDQIGLALKNVKGVRLEVVDARALLVGRAFDNLTPWYQRAAKGSANFDTVHTQTGTAFIRIPGSYDYEARICARVADAFPATILAMAREVDLGG